MYDIEGIYIHRYDINVEKLLYLFYKVNVITHYGRFSKMLQITVYV